MKRRRLDPNIAELLVEERDAILTVARRLPRALRADLVQEVLAEALDAAARGTFQALGVEAEMRASIRAYLRTIARRLVRERRLLARVEVQFIDALEPYDPLPMFEARSDLAALDLSPVAIAFFAAVAFEGNVFRAAARMGWPVGTAYSRRAALRRDALVALRRIRRQ